MCSSDLELLRILSRHPEFEVCVVTSEQRAGAPVGDGFPSLRGIVNLDFEANDPAAIAGRVDLAFTALPHAASAPTVVALRKAGVRIKLGGQPSRVLTLLVEREGALITRQELKDALWKEGTFTDFDHGVDTAIERMRVNFPLARFVLPV